MTNPKSKLEEILKNALFTSVEYGAEHCDDHSDKLRQSVLDSFYYEETLQALDKYYQDYYLGLLPEKKKASRTSPDNGDSNHSHRLGFSNAIDQIEASIRGGK